MANKIPLTLDQHKLIGQQFEVCLNIMHGIYAQTILAYRSQDPINTAFRQSLLKLEKTRLELDTSLNNDYPQNNFSVYFEDR